MKPENLELVQFLNQGAEFNDSPAAQLFEITALQAAVSSRYVRLVHLLTAGANQNAAALECGEPSLSRATKRNAMIPGISC